MSKTTTTLRAFHGDAQIKEALLKRLRDDAAHDRIVKGQYWEHGKGCAVGCTIRGSDHRLYESEYGIPTALAHLEDAIFEGLPNADAMTWPIRFVEAIPVGADLSRVSWALLHTILTDEAINPGITHELVRDAVAQCADIMRRLSVGEDVAESVKSAKSAAKSAAESAESAAESAKSAAWSAWSAAWSAWSAAESAKSAAESVKSAAWSAENAAESVKSAADSAWSAAWSAENAAESVKSVTYQAMDRRLIKLLANAPVRVTP